MERRIQSSDGLELVYDDVGPQDGVPIVLCHGLAAAGRQFATDGAFFAATGHRVLMPDLRGHGRSGKPEPIAPEGFALPRMAADLTEILDHAGVGPVHWVGNSLGGILALQLLGSTPERFLSVATFGTAYALDLPPWGTPLIPFSTKLFGKQLSAWATAWGTTSDPAARQVISDMLKGNDYDCVGATAYNAARYDLIRNAQDAGVPLLLMHCGRDHAVNAALPKTFKAMSGHKGFSVVEIPTGGHCANLDATTEFRAALATFWTRVTAGRAAFAAV